MNNIKKVSAVSVLAIVSAGTLLAGCGASQNNQSGSGSNGKVTELQVITQDRWAPYLDEAQKMWNSEHPNEQVKLNEMVIGYPQLRQKLTTSVAAGNAPDFSLIDSVWVDEFAKNGYLAPLDSIDQSWVESDYKKDFYPVFVSSDSYQGHPYAIRTQTDMAIVWYRKDWFAAEGLQAPKTWSDLEADAKHFAEPSVMSKYHNAQGIAFPAGINAAETTTYTMMPFLWSNGAKVFNNGKVTLNSKATKDTLHMLNGLVQDGSAPKDVTSYQFDSGEKLFATGQTAIEVGGSYEYPMIKKTSGWSDADFKQKVGFVSIPAGPNGTSTTTAGGMDYAIFKQSKNQQLSLDILKLVTGPKLMKQFVEDTAQNSPRISVTNSLDKNKDWFLIETGKFLYNANARPLTAEYAKVSEEIQTMIDNAVSGNTSVDDAVTKAANDISQITGLSQQ